MASSIASSSRITLASAAQIRCLGPPGAFRTMVHHARPPRVPKLIPTPHISRQPRSSAGTSTPQPLKAGSQVSPTDATQNTSGVPLSGTSLTLHHSPPPSAPSYTTGAVPSLLEWLNGNSVQLTGQEIAPRRKERRGIDGKKLWDSGVKMEIIEMRQRGMSRSQIAKQLDIPAADAQHIARIAPLTAEQKADKETLERERLLSLGNKKKLVVAKRQRRKEFW